MMRRHSTENSGRGLSLLIYPSPLLGPGRVGKIGRSLQATGNFTETQIVGIKSGDVSTSQEVGPQVRIVRIPGAGIRDFLGGVRIMLFWPLRVYRRYRKQKLSAVAAQNVYMLPLAYHLSRKTGAVFGYNAHELETETIGAVGLKKKIVKFLERRYIGKADVVSVVNQSIADWYTAHYPGLHPVVVTNVPISGGETVDVRAKLGIPAGELLYIHVGFLVPGRNIPLLLKEFAVRPQVHLAFMGNGPLLPEVQRTAEVAPNIHLLPMVPPDSVVSVVRGADVAINLIEHISLSYRLSTPNKLMKALAAGTPPLSSDLVEARRLFGPELSATWILESPEEQLAGALERIGPDDIAAFQASCPQIPTWEEQAQDLVAAYEQALRRRGA